jgi:hypothetical protein
MESPDCESGSPESIPQAVCIQLDVDLVMAGATRESDGESDGDIEMPGWFKGGGEWAEDLASG